MPLAAICTFSSGAFADLLVLPIEAPSERDRPVLIVDQDVEVEGVPLSAPIFLDAQEHASLLANAKAALSHRGVLTRFVSPSRSYEALASTIELPVLTFFDSPARQLFLSLVERVVTSKKHHAVRSGFEDVLLYKRDSDQDEYAVSDMLGALEGVAGDAAVAMLVSMTSGRKCEGLQHAADAEMKRLTTAAQRYAGYLVRRGIPLYDPKPFTARA